MKNGLNEFVNRNRDEFDSRVPADRVWNRISFSMGFGFSWWNNVALWRAAAVLMMGLSLFLFLTRTGHEPGPALTQQDFGDVELFYKAQISEKVALIHDAGDLADDSFTQDLQKLEAMYTVLHDEMKRHPSEKVKDALVLNMIVRIDLLNQQIQKLEESAREKDIPATI
ncbi:MAG TPA: hypothetical protein PLX35_03770 [Cyclobacteriaceae bacterium]|nr:hypothetical protein [Cyclobacteriaceae bacterium]